MPAMYGAIPGALPGAIPGMGMMPGPGDSIDLFCQRNKLDASAQAKLRALTPELQRQVIDRGDLLDARNPNAVLMGRIRDAERGGGGGGQPACFIRRYTEKGLGARQPYRRAKSQRDAYG